MSNTISYVIGVLLAFVLLVLAPMTISRMTDDMAARRLILNETGMFIDKVTDKGCVTDTDVEDLMFGINSHGGAYDATIVRYVRIAAEDNINGGVRSMYCAADDNINALPVGGKINLNVGDAIQVRVNAVSRTKGQVLLNSLLRVYEKPFSFTLAGTVR